MNYLAKRCVECSRYLIEDVEIPLTRLLCDHPSLLQQVSANVPTQWVSFEVKVDVHVLTLNTKDKTFGHTYIK